MKPPKNLNKPIFYERILRYSLVLLFLAGCHSRLPVSNPFYRTTFQHMSSMSPQEGLIFLDSVHTKLFRSHPPGADDIVEYYRTRISFLRSTNLPEGLVVLDSLETFLRKHSYLPKFNFYFAEMLIAKVEAYTLTHQYDNGLAMLASAKQFIDDNMRDSCRGSQYKQTLAGMLTQQKRFLLAAAFYVESVRDAQLCDSSSFERYYYSYSGLMNAGYCYYESKMYDSSQYYLERAFKLIDLNEARFPDKSGYFALSRGVLSRHLALTKIALKEYAQAEPLMQRAVNATAKEYPDFANLARMGLAEIYVKSMQLYKAKQALDGLDSVTINPPYDYAFHISLNQNKKDYFQKQGDFAKAMYYNDIANTWRDSMEVGNSRNIDRDFASEVASNQQRQINDNLKIENERTSFHLQIAVLLVIIALLAIILTWTNLRKAARHAKIQKNLNEALQLKNQDILDAYASLDSSYMENTSLMRTVAHDLKNPLSAIKTLIPGLVRKADEQDVKETLELIHSACTNSINLINDLEASDKLKFQKINKEMNDMARLLRNCVDMMKPRAEEKKQQLILEAQYAEAPINKDKMWRVITNIINNAIKFSPVNGIILIKLEKVESDVVLSVHDDGIGIPEHLQAKIFESNPEAQRPGTSGEKSYGMGLGISKKIVEEHQGKLWVESEEGLGTTFFIMLPSGN